MTCLYFFQILERVGGGAQIWDDVKNGGRGFTFSIPVVIIFSVLIAAQLENVFSLLLKFS